MGQVGGVRGVRGGGGDRGGGGGGGGVGGGGGGGGVTVIGAGIAGAACAASLRRAGLAVRWCDRGSVAGGRMASPIVHGRAVDIGASYFTVRDPAFGSLVEGWAAAGLARPWTDTFAAFEVGAEPSTSSGPMRWAAPAGLQSLVAATAGADEGEGEGGGEGEGEGGGSGGVILEVGRDLDALPDGHVVLAMPDPQAACLVPIPDAVAYDPTIAVVLGFEERSWSFDGAFVNGHPTVNWVADDGTRRGDGAPVLVAHTTAGEARRLAGSPASLAARVVSETLRELIGLPEPAWTSVHYWEAAKPAGSHPSTFGLIEEPGGRLIGLAGDQWSGSTTPRVESAWRSGVDLAGALVARLG